MLESKSKQFKFILLILVVLVFAFILLNLILGTYIASINDIYRTLFRVNTSFELDVMLLDFRLSRIMIAILVGFSLGITGTVIQTLTQNGLADPSILGINAGAGFGIVLFSFFFLGDVSFDGWQAALILPVFAFVGGLLAAIIILLLTFESGKLNAQTLILVGIAIGSGFSALTIYISLKMEANQFDAITIWLSGTIWNANWYFVVLLFPVLVLFIPFILLKAHLLDLFQLKEETVIGLGVRSQREKITLILTSIAIISLAVSVSGNIAFVGLMAPHISRKLVGLTHRYILPISGCVGVLLMLISDLIARTVFSPVELPVGIVVSIIGVPYFIYLLISKKAT